MKYSSSVKAILFASISELDDNPDLYAKHPDRGFTRNRKLGFQDFLILFLTMEVECIKEELYCYFERDTSTPSKAAFCKQQSKLRQDAPRNFIFAFNSKLKRNLYNGKYQFQFIACDESVCDIFRNPKVPNEPSGTLSGTLEEKILSVIRKSPHITKADIAAKIECPERKVKRLMKKMIVQGMIERVGGRKMGQWIEK